MKQNEDRFAPYRTYFVKTTAKKSGVKILHTLTTIPPEDPPQAASEPIGVRLALSLRSMMIG